MQAGAITGYIDVAQVALYGFWVFFAGLIFYLRREDKREGYPLVTERPGQLLDGFPRPPPPKTYLLPHGGTVSSPRVEPPQPPFDAVPVAGWPGAPLQPIGNPMLSGLGPAASALRADTPDLMNETTDLRIVPLRVAIDHYLDDESPDPRTMPVIGADGVAGGIVSDIWIDRAETMIRYLEVTLVAGPSVLLPVPMVRIDTRAGVVNVKSILGAQFEDAPMLANPDQVTLREEDRIQAYFASGHLYAVPSRLEPLL
ncbi:MAG TPA: photosynthetic reaction center subunit H [Acetobacteraceae bacterium]|jgi:photosynthetic reaction center H subunit|nr:photosynthetic reaction center subunit H [Acetobacteraceae bacterium]